jgi:hypothetical protein
MELMGRGGDGAGGRRSCSPCLYQSWPPCLPLADCSPFSFFFKLIYLKFYDAVKVVSIHKSNRFGIKNWSVFCFFRVWMKFQQILT